ncbi:MAG: FadR family transcriptional regulator [Lachnospiraceae bacterium]|nr:FadR family transcriptional regulator [Lachnospiraceae bacterium]
MEQNLFSGYGDTVADTVFERLFKRIASGEFLPGDKIPSENELCAQWGVSRNTLRSAINRLATMGILETRRGDGSYVRQFGVQTYINTFIPAMLINEDSLMELIQLRKAIEVASARLAAERATPEDIEALEDCYEASTRAGENMKVYAESTVDFHYQVAVTSKNQIFSTMMEIIKFIITSKMENFLVFSRNDKNSTYYHFMILQAIKNHKPDEASFLMEAHMNFLVSKVQEYEDYIKEHPGTE